MRRRFNALVLAGAKRATATTLDEDARNNLGRVGERQTLVDDDFGALAEGEGDESIAQWRAGHRRFWEGEGLGVPDDTPVWLIFFELVGPGQPGELRS